MLLSLKHQNPQKQANTLFLHGLLGSGSDWSETIKALGDPIACATLDLPSHGDSQEIAPLVTSFEEVIDVIGTALKESIAKPLHGVGYSLGGRILLGLTQTFPELFSKLTFISTFPGFRDDRERAARWESDLQWSKLLRTLDTQTFLARWYAQGIFASEQWSDSTRERICNARSSLSLPRIAQFFELTSAAKMPSYWEHLASLTIPTTFIAGERDSKYMRIGQELAALNPAITLTILDECAHAIPLEAPRKLAKVI